MKKPKSTSCLWISEDDDRLAGHESKLGTQKRSRRLQILKYSSSCSWAVYFTLRQGIMSNIWPPRVETLNWSVSLKSWKRSLIFQYAHTNRLRLQFTHYTVIKSFSWFSKRNPNLEIRYSPWAS